MLPGRRGGVALENLLGVAESFQSPPTVRPYCYSGIHTQHALNDQAVLVSYLQFSVGGAAECDVWSLMSVTYGSLTNTYYPPWLSNMVHHVTQAGDVVAGIVTAGCVGVHTHPSVTAIVTQRCV